VNVTDCGATPAFVAVPSELPVRHCHLIASASALRPV